MSTTDSELCGWIDMIDSIEKGCTSQSTVDRVVAIHGQRLVVGLCDKHDRALDQVHAQRRNDRRAARKTKNQPTSLAG